MNRSDVKADTEELVRISLWCSDNLSHDRMKVGVAMQFYMGDFVEDPLAGSLSDAAKWRHLQAIEEARTARPAGAIPFKVFKALTIDLERRDRKLLKVLWPKHGDLRWNRGVLKTVVAALGTKLARGAKSRGAKLDECRDAAIEMIKATAPDDSLVYVPPCHRPEKGCDRPDEKNVTPSAGEKKGLLQTGTGLSQRVDRPPSPSSSSSSSPPAGEEEDPPLGPQGGEKGRIAKGRDPRRRKIPDVTIPPELLAIGIDQDDFEQRVLGRERTKPLSAWQSELDDLVPMVEECGGRAVIEAFKNATSGAWTSCLPKHVRAARTGRDGGSKGRPEGGRIPVLPTAHDADCMGCQTCGEVVDTPGLVMPTNCMRCDLAHYGPHNDPTDASALYAGYVYELGPDGRPNEWRTP